jgi:hypothetical protein
MDGKEAECPLGALRFQRAWSTLGASSDVSKSAVPVITTAIVQLLARRTEIAVAFRLVREALRAEQRTPCPSYSIARGHVRRDLSVHQPLQQLTIAIAGIGSDGLRVQHAVAVVPVSMNPPRIFGKMKADGATLEGDSFAWSL